MAHPSSSGFASNAVVTTSADSPQFINVENAQIHHENVVHAAEVQDVDEEDAVAASLMQPLEPVPLSEQAEAQCHQNDDKVK